jgi:tetratricopeptide (TPR) repeat protein
MTKFVTNIAGDVEKLVNIAVLNGDFINHGTIYLTTSFEVYKKLESTTLSKPEFKKFAQHYHEALKEQYGKVKIASYPEDLDFDAFYVQPIFKLVAGASAIGGSSNRENHTIDDVLKSSEYIYIQGAPGSGKTILLKSILAKIGKLKIMTIPIFVSLSIFKSYCSSNPKFSLYDYISKELASYGFPVKFVDFVLKNKLALILMDGLDEIYVKESEKLVIYNQIDDFNKLHEAKVLLTSRCMDFDFSSRKKLNYQILPFNFDQIQEYLDKTLTPKAKVDFLRKLDLMHNFTFEGRNREDNNTKAWAMDRVMMLVNAGLFDSRVGDEICKKKPLPQVASTPLLLSILISNYIQHKIVPASKNNVFDSIVGFMVDKWFKSEHSEFFKNRLNLEDAYQLLYYISFFTLKNKETLISRKQLYLMISNYLISEQYESFIAADDIIKTFRTDMGVIVDFDNDQYTFIHPVIQEYLAARYLCQKKNYLLIFSNQLFLETKWLEVLELVTERLGNTAEYLDCYKKALVSVSKHSLKVHSRINYAIQKSLLTDGSLSLYAVFYYICISIYFKSGERARYSCMRLAHIILSLIYDFKHVYVLALARFTGELTRVAKEFDFKDLIIDSWILQLLDKYTEKNIEFNLNVEDIIHELELIDVLNLSSDLRKFEEKRQMDDEDEAAEILIVILNKRGVFTQETLDAEELNILSTYVDLIELYVVAVPEREMISQLLNDIFLNPSTDLALSDPVFSDFMNSFDYSQLSDLYFNNDMDRCIEYCNKAIDLNPTHGGFYNTRGATLCQSGRPKDGMEDLLIAEFLNPAYKTDFLTQRCLANLFRRISDYENALFRFKVCVTLNKKDQISDRWFMSEIYMHQGLYDLAIDILNQIPNVRKDMTLFYYARSYCQMQLGNYANAILDLQPFYSARTLCEEGVFIYALCKAKLEEYEEAKNAIWTDGLSFNSVNDMYCIVLLLCFKMLEDNVNYNLLLEQMYEKEIIASREGLLKLEISPGHLELQFYDQTNFIRDYEIQYDLNTPKIFL